MHGAKLAAPKVFEGFSLDGVQLSLDIRYVDEHERTNCITAVPSSNPLF